MAKIKIEEFFVEGSQPQKSHVLIHIAEPTTPEEEKRGYFFALAEINNNNPLQISNLQSIIDEIETRYYENNLAEENLDNLFEQIIQTVNKKSADVLGYENSEINCLVATLRGNKISFAYQGHPRAFLFFKKNEQISDIKIIDSPAFSFNQLFCSVIEGNINENDTIFLYTPTIEKNFEIEKIKNLIQDKDIKEVSVFLGRSLEILDSEKSFGGIFIHKEKEDNIIKTTPIEKSELGSEESLKNLNSTAENTTAVLSPSIIGSLNQKLKSRKKENAENKNPTEIKTTKHGAIETNVRREKKEENFLNKFLISFGKILVLIFKNSLNFTKKIFMKVGDLFLSLFLVISNKNGKRTLILDKYQTKISQKKNTIDNLGVLPKIFFISILILIFIFIANVFYLKHKDKKEAEQAQYDNTIVLIEEKIDEAEAKLLYEEEAAAYEILQKATEIKNSLNTNSDERINQKQEISDKIDNLLTQLRKITIIYPESLIEIKNEENQDVNTQKIIFVDNNEILAYSRDDNNLYIANPILNTIEIKNHDTYPNFKNAKIDSENGIIYFLYDDNKLLNYDIKNKSFSNKDISYPNDDLDIIDFDIYNGKIYTFDKNNEQIYKHNPTQTGFDKGSEWISDKENDLSEVSSISIDSNIFLLGSGQNIYKFNKGTEYVFELTGIDPIINQATKIWTNYESDYIYILDGQNKRIVIIDKEGHFISQYLAQEWNNPTDMFVNEEKNEIYVLDQNKIYKFSYEK